MTDLARLGLEFRADGLGETNAGLDQLTQKAGAAERATDSLSAGSRRAGGAIAQMLASIERSTRELVALTRAQSGAAQATSAIAQAQTQAATATSQAGAANVRYTQSFQPLRVSIDATRSALGGFSVDVDRAAAATAKAGQQARVAASHFDTLYDEFDRDFVGQYARAINQASTVTGKATVNTKAMTQATLGLSRQFADIAVTGAMGMNPLMILIQQGPQIADQLALMRMQGIGLSAALRQMTASAAPLLIALAPLIALSAAAAAGFALMHRELAKGFPKDITKGMDLTEEQLERVKSKAVTMGDTFRATLDVMGKYLVKGPVGDGIKWLAKQWNDLMDEMAKAALDALTSISAVFVGSYRWIVNNWRNLPAVFKDLFAMAVNLSIDALQNLLNAQTQVFRSMKDLLGFLVPALKPVLEQLNNVDLSGFKMRVSSAAAFVGKSLVENIKQAKVDAERGVDKLGDEIAAGALARARKRALAEAGKPNKVTGADKEEIDAQTLALQAFADQMERMRREAEELSRIKFDFIDTGLNQAILDADAAQSAAEQMGFIADQARAMGDSLADGFGRGGAALATLMDGMAQFRAQESAILAERAASYASYQQAKADFENKEVKTAQDRFEMMRTEMQWDRDRQKSQRDLLAAETRRNVAAIEGVKSLLSRKSAAYKVLTALEIGFQAVELAGHLKRMAQDAIATAATIANSVKTAAIFGAQAIANALRSVPFPFNLAAAAATAAALVAVGVKVFGGGGGGGAAVPTAEEIQARQGAGSVLGDAEAKSESISRSLEIVASNTNRDLEYSNGMLRHLRSIDGQIGALTGLLARQLVSGGFLDEAQIKGVGSRITGINDGIQGFGKFLGIPTPMEVLSKLPVVGGIIKGLFGTKVTTTVRDLGLDFDPQSLDSIVNGGLSGDAYQTLDIKTKKKFLGITASNKTKTRTTETPLEQDILNEMAGIIESLRGGVLEAASLLGVEGAAAALQAFTVDLGTVSFKDKTAAEIQEELNAIFSKLGDQMAEAAFPFIAELQKVGEGAFETLIRVARQYQVIDITLQSIGRTFGAVGVESLALRENLIDLFGSLDEFVEQTQFFAENFLTEAERMAPIQAAIVKEFQRLGVTGVNTKEQFKQLVLGLDLTSQAGQEMYAALLAIAPAFSKVFEYLTEGSKELEKARNDLLRAYEKESGALQETIDKFNTFAKSLRQFRESLSTGPNALLSPEAQYAANRAKFEDVSRRAALGDEQALGDLQNVSQAYLDASRAYYASSGKYFQDLTAVKAAVQAAEATATRTAQNAKTELDALNDLLDMTDGVRDGLVKLGDTTLVMKDGVYQTADNVLKVVDAIAALQVAMLAQTAAGLGTPFSPLSPTGQPSYTYTPTPTPIPAATPTPPAPAPGFDPTYGYLTPEQQQQLQDYLNSMNLAGVFGGGGGGLSPHMLSFGVGGSFSVAGEGPKDFGPVTLHGGEAVNVSREDTMAAVVKRLDELIAENRSLRATVAKAAEVDAAEQRRASTETTRAIRRQGETPRLVGGGRA
jgi:hypothetical protein